MSAIVHAGASIFVEAVGSIWGQRGRFCPGQWDRKRALAHYQL
jgi:hypothetical protein